MIIVRAWAQAFLLPLIAMALCLPCMADQRASSSQASGDGNGTQQATERACNALMAQAAQALAAGRRYDAEMALRCCIERAGDHSGGVLRAQLALADVRARAGYAQQAATEVSNLLATCAHVPKSAVVVYARVMCAAGRCSTALAAALDGLEQHGVANCMPDVDPLLCLALAHLGNASCEQVARLYNVLGTHMTQAVHAGDEPYAALLASQRYLLRLCYAHLTNSDDRALVAARARAAEATHSSNVPCVAEACDVWRPHVRRASGVSARVVESPTVEPLYAMAEEALRAAESGANVRMIECQVRTHLDELDRVVYDGYQGSFVVSSALAELYARQTQWHQALQWANTALAHVGSSRGHPERLAQLLIHMAAGHMVVSNDLAMFDYYAQWADDSARNNEHVAGALAVARAWCALYASKTNEAYRHLADYCAQPSAGVAAVATLAEWYASTGAITEALQMYLRLLQRALCQQEYAMVYHWALTIDNLIQIHPDLDDTRCRDELSTLAARLPATQEHSAVIRNLLHLRE